MSIHALLALDQRDEKLRELIRELTNQRDDARREWCRLWASTNGRNLAPTQAARLRQWDCFKKVEA